MIDYRGLTTPIGRTVGSMAVLGAVTATAVVHSGESAQAAAPAPPPSRTVAGNSPGADVAAPTIAPAKSYSHVKLRKGARGAAVTDLQKKLNNHGASISADGVFGAKTLKAVRSFQSSKGLGVDGVVGPKTWKALGSASSGSGGSDTGSSQPKLRQGSRGEAVRTLQKKLNNHGAGVSVDGVFGSGTNKAVRNFQSSKGLGVDGVVGPKTWSKLSGSSGGGGGGESGSSQPKLRQGSRGEAVRTLQKQLNNHGAGVSVDGVFGSGTKNAVRGFQRSAGLGVDGVVGPKTWNALNSGNSYPIDNGGGGGSGSWKGDAIVSTARQYLGVPYLWGGTTPSGFDCSGLVQYVYAKHGIQVPRVSKDQIFGGKIIPQSQARPGDLVGFTNNNYGHIGIYLGNGRILDAPSKGRPVQERNIWSAPHVFVTYR